MSNHDPRSNRGQALLPALAGGVRDGFRHWRLLLLAWLAGLLPAAFLGMPVSALFDRLFGHHPDAARIVSGEDLAPLTDAVSGLGDGGFAAASASIGQGLGVAMLLAGLLAPWLSGMLIASLRERRVLGFGELWSGGWREYGRQFRLLLVALIPAALFAGVAAAAFGWARYGSETRILESVAAQRMNIAMIVVAITGLIGWMGIECARAAFAADASLRSAFRAWLRGLRLMVRRPFAVLLAVILTLLLGMGLSMLLQAGALSNTTGSGLVLLLAQIAVWIVWWSRVVRLSTLAAISPAPATAIVPQPHDADTPMPVGERVA